jgi:2-alkyl-3-oxoalkanoate reductase
MSGENKPVIVTGATGTVGTHLTQALIDAGWHPIRISRTTPNPIAGSVHFAVDLANSSNPLPYFGADVPVINCAAITKDGYDPTLEIDNLTITENALKLSAGPLIHVSSSSVYNLNKPSITVNETEATGNYAFLNSYSRSKWHTEQLVHAAARNAIILRPHAVYGPGDTTLLPRLQRSVRNSMLLLPGGGKAEHAMTSLTNLTTAIIAALTALTRHDNPFTGVTAVNITDADPVQLGAVIPELLNLLGTPAKIVPVPVSLALAAAYLTERNTPQGSEPRISRYAVRQLAHTRTYDLTLARTLLGYLPEPNSLLDCYRNLPNLP